MFKNNVNFKLSTDILGKRRGEERDRVSRRRIEDEYLTETFDRHTNSSTLLRHTYKFTTYGKLP